MFILFLTDQKREAEMVERKIIERTGSENLDVTERTRLEMASGAG